MQFLFQILIRLNKQLTTCSKTQKWQTTGQETRQSRAWFREDSMKNPMRARNLNLKTFMRVMRRVILEFQQALLWPATWWTRTFFLASSLLICTIIHQTKWMKRTKERRVRRVETNSGMLLERTWKTQSFKMLQRLCQTTKGDRPLEIRTRSMRHLTSLERSRRRARRWIWVETMIVLSALLWMVARAPTEGQVCPPNNIKRKPVE